MTNPLRALPELGQSIWYDYIRKDLVEDGGLDSLIRDDGLRGMTTNPAIFQSAVASGTLYDEAIREAGPDASPMAAYESLAIRDVRAAADRFAAVYEHTNGLDGYVSLEVDPRLAHDTEATIAEAKRLFATVDRPNIMIKIPGTEAGLPAIEAVLREGIHVNVTLLFSVERYEAVMAAFERAIRYRHDAGLPVAIASVASFFVSRVDSLVDSLLEASAVGDPNDRAELMGRAGVANARLAYRAFMRTLGAGSAFDDLKAAGGRPQRPLWASTSTKNPAYPDTLYVDELIAPDSVNTIPPKTYDAFRDHGDPTVRILEGETEAVTLESKLAAVGVDLKAVVKQLEDEGVSKFVKAFESLLSTIEEKQAKLQ